MKLYVLDCGIITLPRYNIVSDENALNNPALLMEIPIAAYLIDHPAGLVLFDAACDPQGMSQNWPEVYHSMPYVVQDEMYLPQRLEQIGVKPEDIQYVIASHLHIDHAGCIKFFKNATVVVNTTELETTIRTFRAGGDLNSHVPSDVQSWVESPPNWLPINDDQLEYELLPGITILNFGKGHAWGMLGALAELAGAGNLLFVSDAIYTPENEGPPLVLPGIIDDPDAYVKTVDRIHQYQKKYNAKIIYGHDMEQFALLKQQADPYLD